MSISIDIVVPHYADIKRLKAMLTSLEEATLPESIKNIFIIENGPISGAENECRKRVGKLPLKYLYSKEPGLANARNLGVTYSKADFIIFLDNDLLFEHDSFLHYEKAFSKYGQQYFYGGPVEPLYENPPEQWKLQYVPASVKGFCPFNQDTVVNKGLFLGGNHALSKECIKQFSKNVYQGESATSTGGGVGEEHRLQESLIALNLQGVFVKGALVHHPIPTECFTIQWICNRRYRRGLTDSQNINFQQSRLHVANIPFWVLKHYLINSGYYLLNCMASNQEKALEYGVQQAWAKGFIDGTLNKDRNRK